MATAEPTKKKKLKALAEKSTKSASVHDVKSNKKSEDLQTVEPPKNLGDACIAFDLKEIKSKVGSALDILSIANAADDNKNAENSVLLDFRDKSNVVVMYIRAGALVTIDVQAKVFKTGTLVLDAAVFRAIRGNSPYVVLSLDSRSSSISFRCGSTRGSVQMLSTYEEYVMSAPDVKVKTDNLIPKTLVAETFSRLLFNSFDPGIPAMGLPLHVSVKKSVLTITSFDNLVGAVYTKQDCKLSDFETVLPGTVFTRIAKHMDTDVLKCGFTEKAFRVRSHGIDVIHPMATYDLIDILAYLEEEQGYKAEFEMILPTNDFMDAIESAMCMSSIDKTESKITIEFEETKGRVLFQGSNTQSKSPFQVKKMIKPGKNMVIITNGKRIMSFINILKGFVEFRMRVRKGRAYLFAPDNSFTFMIPLS